MEGSKYLQALTRCCISLQATLVSGTTFLDLTVETEAPMLERVPLTPLGNDHDRSSEGAEVKPGTHNLSKVLLTGMLLARSS